jgi:Domain of unknown function (DUF932)
MAKKVQADLISHCGTDKVDRAFLERLTTPERTDTFQPIAHKVLVDAVEESLAFRHISLTQSEFAVSKDGMKMFGLLQVNSEYEGVQFAIGLRNANDKSMSLGMVAGYRVFVCDNLALSGDFNPLQAKHSKNLNLVEAISMGIDRIQRHWDPLRSAITQKMETALTDDEAKLAIYNYFTKGGPVSLFKTVHREYFEPSYEDFKPRTVWSLENAITTGIKTLKPVAQFPQLAKTGKYIAGLLPAAPLALAA